MRPPTRGRGTTGKGVGSMYVQLSRKLPLPGLVTSDKNGEPILVLREGERVDGPFIKVLDDLLCHFTTYEAARAQVLAAPLTYPQAATALGAGLRWVQRGVANKTLPHYRIGNHVLFLPDQIEDIRAACRRGDLRYGGERQRRFRL